jgi:hypothetical protein
LQREALNTYLMLKLRIREAISLLSHKSSWRDALAQVQLTLRWE